MKYLCLQSYCGDHSKCECIGCPQVHLSLLMARFFPRPKLSLLTRYIRNNKHTCSLLWWCCQTMFIEVIGEVPSIDSHDTDWKQLVECSDVSFWVSVCFDVSSLQCIRPYDALTHIFGQVANTLMYVCALDWSTMSCYNTFIVVVSVCYTCTTLLGKWYSLPLTCTSTSELSLKECFTFFVVSVLAQHCYSHILKLFVSWLLLGVFYACQLLLLPTSCPGYSTHCNLKTLWS